MQPTFPTIHAAIAHVDSLPMVEPSDIVGRWTGHDTCGNQVEKLITPDGRCFSRHHGWNGYGLGWSKWESCKTVHVSRLYWLPSEGNSGAFHLRDAPVVKWGFNKLTRHPIGNCRPPKDGPVVSVLWSDSLA